MARQITNEGKWAADNSVLTADKINTVLTTINTDNYPETISGQIDRIGDAHEIIQAKAYEMKLNIQANQGDSKSTSAVRLEKNGNHKIMDTASAINSINVQPFLLKTGNNYISADSITLDSTTLTSGIEYKIPIGYNTTELTIELPSLVGNATANWVLSGKTFYNDSYTKQTGTMTDHNGNVPGVGVSSYIKDGKNCLRTRIAQPGYYDSNDYITTDRSWYTGEQSIYLNITKTTINNNDTYICTSGSLPEGYYKNATIKYDISEAIDSKGEVFNIYDSPTSEVELTNQIGIIPVPTGYDYQTNRSYSIINAIGEELDNGTFKVTTAGWTPIGVYGTGFGDYLEKSTHTLTARDNNKFGTSTTISAGNITTLTKQYYTDVITKGHTDGETKYLKVQDCAFSLDATVDGDIIYQPTITKNSETNVASSSAVTTKPSSGYYVAVKSSANTNSAKAIASIMTDLPGWKSDADDTTYECNFYIKTSASETTYIPINATTITANITGTTKVTPTIIADPNIEQSPAGASPISNAEVSTTPPNSGYYFKVITEAISNNITPTWSSTAGYTPETSGSGTAIAVGANASESHYVKIPAATLRTVTATNNQSSNKLEFSGGKSVSNGYVTTSTAQNLPTNINGWNGSTATSATSGTNQVYSNTITARDQDLYIKQGVYLTKDIKINKVSAGIGKITSANSIKDITYVSTIDKASATYRPNNDADTTNNPTYFSSVEVDVTDIVKALMAI